MDLTEDLRAIDWPESFCVFYCDGTSELLLRGDGIGLTPPQDDPDGIGGFDACIPKKHPKNQHQVGRYVRYTELQKIVGADGTILFARSLDSQHEGDSEAHDCMPRLHG